MALLLLFASCFLSASIVPFASEPYFVGLIIHNSDILITTVVATLGNTLGGVTSFWIGKKSGILITRKFSDKKLKRFYKAQKTVSKYGATSMLLSWVPIIGDVIVLAGGIFNLAYTPSIIWMTIGKALRYIILAYISLGFL